MPEHALLTLVFSFSFSFLPCTSLIKEENAFQPLLQNHLFH
ncbi:hypothetical protein BMWSH_1404 [Priestia megaterium WSH-002]|uniref:Uncharacterized protein n=1 Tax=Priestia megaterium (strain WSH-002) TaxID=1006007 RepID=A0A8D3WX77_PRIMW|nr:hypothetical protein BMWSH_1404 [Priestia megaterium WSH-002]